LSRASGIPIEKFAGAMTDAEQSKETNDHVLVQWSVARRERRKRVQ